MFLYQFGIQLSSTFIGVITRYVIWPFAFIWLGSSSLTVSDHADFIVGLVLIFVVAIGGHWRRRRRREFDRWFVFDKVGDVKLEENGEEDELSTNRLEKFRFQKIKFIYS
jgi:hypothetical protein